MNKNFLKIALALPLFALVGCDEDLVKSDYDLKPEAGETAQVETRDVLYNFGKGVVVNLGVPAENPENVEYGVVCDTVETLDLANPAHIVAKAAPDADGNWTASISGLEDGRTYYYKAYAYNTAGTTYGEIKEVLTDGSLSESRTDFAVDFSDMTGADSQLFTTPQFAETAYPFTAASLKGFLGADLWGFVSTCFDIELLFGQGQGSVLGGVDNMLVFKADFTGKYFPTLTLSALNLCSLFGPDYAGLPGNFEVRISKDPVTDQATYEAATLISKCEFPIDPEDPDQMSKEFVINIPGAYTGECYIVIKNGSIFNDDMSGNLGVVIFDYVLSSLYMK